MKELSKYCEIVAPINDFPTPVGAQRIIFLIPLSSFSLISDSIDFCMLRGVKFDGNFSNRDRIKGHFFSY